MKAMETIRHNKELVQQARSAFVRRVNIVVEENEVATTDTFKVTFDLDISCIANLILVSVWCSHYKSKSKGLP